MKLNFERLLRANFRFGRMWGSKVFLCINLTHL